MFFSNKPHYAIVNDTVEASKEFKKDGLVNAVLRSVLRDKNNIQLGKFIYPKFKKIVDKVFSSNSIREYIYQTLFEKPINYQVSLKDQKDAIYEKRVFLLEKKIKSNCYVQDIGNFEIIRSTISCYHDKDILDICAAPGGKSVGTKGTATDGRCCSLRTTLVLHGFQRWERKMGDLPGAGVAACIEGQVQGKRSTFGHLCRWLLDGGHGQFEAGLQVSRDVFTGGCSRSGDRTVLPL